MLYRNMYMHVCISPFVHAHKYTCHANTSTCKFSKLSYLILSQSYKSIITAANLNLKSK